MLITLLFVSQTITNVVLKKLTDMYRKGEIQSELSFRTKLHNIMYKDYVDFQKHLTKLENILLNLTRFE